MKYSVIDLFAGAGGLSLGFEMTNKFEIVAFVEKNDEASKTYIENHKYIKRFTDIRTVDFKNVINQTGKVDVVIGGPPCQGFSNANRQKRKIINGNNELVKCYVNAIKEIEPSVFVLENVKTIASDKHSFYLTEQDSNHIVNELGVAIHKKDCILYERKDFINEVFNILNESNFSNYLLKEQDYFSLKTLLKRKNKLNKYLSKKNNIKSFEQISKIFDNANELAGWYIEYIKKVNKVLKSVLNEKTLSDKQYEIIKLYCDMQSLFQGANELAHGRVINELMIDHGQIISRMDTYKVIDYIKASFDNLGYKYNCKVLKAADYGVPQKRERFILIGVKEELIGNKEIKMPNAIFNGKDYITTRLAIRDLEGYKPSTGKMGFSLQKKKCRQERSFFNDIILDSDVIYNHVCTNTKETAKNRFRYIRQGENFHSLPENMKNDTYENPQRTQNTIYKRLLYNEPSDTVVNVRKSMWIHPKFDRALSAREAARLQSFPDSYKFLGSKNSVYQQIGNAVPPLLGRAIAEVVLKLLNEDDFESLEDILSKYK